MSNPVRLDRFHCDSIGCNNTFEVPVLDNQLQFTHVVAENRGWKRDENGWHCDTCSCERTLCPVCKAVYFRYGIDGVCSKTCLAQRALTGIDNEFDAIIEGMKLA